MSSMSTKRSARRPRRIEEDDDDRPVVADVVIERVREDTPPPPAAEAAARPDSTDDTTVAVVRKKRQTKNSEESAPMLKWHEIVSASVTRGFENAQRMLRDTSALQIEDSGLRSILLDGSRGRVMSAFKCATLLDKERVKRAFRMPLMSVNPVRDEMADTTKSLVPVDTPTARGMEFDLLLEEEIYNARGACLSHVRVYNWREWDGRVNAPTRNGLLDERMGPVRNVDLAGNRIVCEVCGGYNNVDSYVNERLGESGLCTGHFGHILVPAVWNPMMQTNIIRMLRCFCWHCGSLPGTDKQNLIAVQEMYATCETRVEKLAFLDRRYRDMKFCEQCSKRGTGCLACEVEVERDAEGDPVPGTEKIVHCDDCRRYKAFRPRVRTTMQADNAKKKLQSHLLDADNMDTVDDDTRRAMRGTNYSGFPCDVLLDGYAEQDPVAYREFAKRVYGRYVDNKVLVMHGERVRAVIAQMSDDFLRLFFESSIDSEDEVRSWFRSQVPRVVPMLPNPARPTNMGTGADVTIRTDDITRRYKELVKRCEALSRALEQHHAPDNPPMFYPTDGDLYSTPRNTWFNWTPADERHIELYSEIQYYYAAVVSDTRALSFLSSMASSHGIGRSAAARRKRTANEAGASNDNSHKAILVASLEQRLKGKEGRERNNLQGKRTNNSARSVITPDHNSSIRELQVPFSIASGLIVSERICSRNAQQLLTRAERARTGDIDAKPHKIDKVEPCLGCKKCKYGKKLTEPLDHIITRKDDCRGCFLCEALAIGSNTELCIYNAERTDRVRFVGRNALTYPVWQHPFVQEPGAVVERSLRTGDYVLLNRQPSLHKHSTMMHRAIVGPYSTLKLAELATPPYNADFDGDEMNIHVAGCVAATAEAVELMKVSAQLISASNSAPVHGLKQDAATGMYLLTSADTFLDREDMCQLMMRGTRNDFESNDFTVRLPPPVIRHKVNGRWQPLWTGVQVAEFTLPQTGQRLNYRHPADFDFKTRSMNYPTKPLVIIDGTIICGRFTKGVTSSNTDSIHRAIFDRAGARLEDSQEHVCDFIDRCAWFASAYVTRFGFGVGIGHCMPKADVAAKIATAADVAETKVAELLRTDKKLLVTDKHADRTSEVEAKIMKIEDDCAEAVMKIVNANVHDDNAFIIMMKSGGKGKKENMMQIMGCVGGQRREGRRVVDTYISNALGTGASGAGNSATSETTSGGTGKRRVQATRDNLHAQPSARSLDYLQSRVSFHDPPYQYPGAAMGGFVKSSFLKGLSPKEFFNHAAGGREGIIDTACKTADTGDAQRLAMKSCEDIAIMYDCTVRGCTNQLVSFRFGGNNYNPVHVLRKPLAFIGMGEQALARALFYNANDRVFAAIGEDRSFLLQQERDLLISIISDLRRWSSVRNSGIDVATPNNMANVIVDALRAVHADATGALWMELDDERVRWDEYQDESVVIAPDECIMLVNEYCRKWRQQRPTSFIDDLTEYELRLRLCSKQVTRRMRLSGAALRAVLDSYEVVLQRTQLPPGEAVGALMVQSVGQPSTQMTLNTFHSAGRNVLGVRKGVPRMKEISQATSTEGMKGLKVTLPVREGLLVSTAQRKLAANIVAKLVLPQTLNMLDSEYGSTIGHFGSWVLDEAAHRQHVQDAMTAPLRQMATQRFATHRASIERSLVKESSKRGASKHTSVLEELFNDIDNFAVAGEDTADDNAPVRTLHALTSHWRTIKTTSMTSDELRGWSTDAKEAFQLASTALVAAIRPQHRLLTTVGMMCESVWRSLVPVFGKDACFNVVARALTQEVPAAADGGKRRRRLTGTTKVVTEIAIVALKCRADYERKLYEHIRLNRHLIFIDLLGVDDDASAVRLARAAMIDAQHARPEMYVTDIDNSGEREREDRLLKDKLTDISSSQMRHLFKNFVSTRLIDIVDSFSVIYLPIRVDGSTGAVSVPFADVPAHLCDGDDDKRAEYETRNFIANDSERLAYKMLFCDGCFDMFEVGCQRELCREARRDANDERHASAVCGCLSSWTLAFRLDRDWFARSAATTAVVQNAIERALGPFYHVFIGDDNSHSYVPMHVRVYTCQLELALAATSKRSVVRLDEASIDDEQLVLERTKWSILNYAFTGPLHGSAVMCEEQRQQVFTNESGREIVQRTVLVSNSSDLYHMMGLRGIDARRVRSNSVHDMLAVVGVEAARMTAINEYTDVMADDGYVNRAHFTLRADVQTRNGGFTPLSAAGLRATPHDVQQSASHRETAKMFVNAALEHRINAPLISPSATVSTANQLGRIGTGAVHLLPDVGAMMHNDAMPQAEPANVIAGLFCSSSAPRQMDGELAELLALAARTPAYSFNSPAQGDDDDNETDWRSMAAAGAMFSPVRELGIDELGTHIVDTQQLPEPTFAGDDDDGELPASQALGDEPVDVESPTHNMLCQIQEAATATTPTTPVDNALRAASDEKSDESKSHDEDEDVDDKPRQRGAPAYSPTSPAMDADADDAPSPLYTPTSPAFSPTSPSKADAEDDGQDQGYNPDRPGYDNTPAPMRGADLDAILKALTVNADVGNSFMVTHTNKVRMF